jgi:hypothetical protein
MEMSRLVTAMSTGLRHKWIMVERNRSTSANGDIPGYIFAFEVLFAERFNCLLHFICHAPAIPHYFYQELINVRYNRDAGGSLIKVWHRPFASPELQNLSRLFYLP